MKNALFLTEFCLMLLIFSAAAFPLQITEIFPGGGFFETEERFVELFNESPTNIALSAIVLVLPGPSGGQTNLGVVRGAFLDLPPGVITQASVLSPGQYLVVATEQINAGTRLLPFAAGCILQKPKNQAFTGWSWTGRLDEISCAAGTELFRCSGDSLPQTLEPGLSLHRADGKYVPGPVSPGHESGYVSAGSYCVGPSGVLEWKHSRTGAEEVGLTALDGTVIQTYPLLPDGRGEFRESLVLPGGLSHGDTVCLDCGAARLLIRIIDPEARSDWHGMVLLNEIVHRSGIDFSGGGWTGSNGGGTCDSADEWVEFVNLSNTGAWSTNGPWYAAVFTEDGERIQKLQYRASKTDDTNGRKYEIPAGGYAVFSVEGGFPDEGKISIYDGHPYRNGRMVDVFSNAAPAWEGENRVSERFPNGCGDYFVFRQSSVPTFAAHNAGAKGELLLFCPPGGTRVESYLSDGRETRGGFFYHSSCGTDMEKVFFTNRGYFARGGFDLSISNSMAWDGLLEVCNGGRLFVFDGESIFSSRVKAELVWTLPGWKVAHPAGNLREAVIYPNPLPAGADAKFSVGNLPEDSEVTLISADGGLKGRWTGVSGGVLSVSLELRPGIYTLLLRHGGEAVWKKLWVR